MMKKQIVLLLLTGGALAFTARDHTLLTFHKIALSDTFYAEGANFGDLNRDGAQDIIAGPYWYEGPDFKTRHEYYTPAPFDPAVYSDNFFAHAYDFNADGWQDIFIIGFPGEEATWYENPGEAQGAWQPHVVFEGVDNESPAWADLTGDGRPELICIWKGRYGYAQLDPAAPTQPWTFHPVSAEGPWQKFTHGLGVGDVNGDGRADLLDKDGWWEQPASLERDPVWTKHEAAFGTAGGAQMHTYDVDGDGDQDVISSLAAHGYGLAWFEHVTRDGRTEFVQHLIINEKPEENPYGVAFAELHAVEVVDMDGDGLKDIVTGKRWWSHGAEGDPDPNPRAYLYWFKTVRHDDGVEFIPYLIDDDTGVGVQVVVGDVNDDNLPDVVISNKKGTAVLLQERREVDEAAWQQAQPRPVGVPAGDSR